MRYLKRMLSSMKNIKRCELKLLLINE
jgi:hypothetical protein